jgi:hypothetical protein
MSHQNIICTVYSHHAGFDSIINTVKKIYPKGMLSFEQEEESRVAHLHVKGGLFRPAKKLKIAYRERAQPSYQLPDANDSPLTANLKGLYGYVSSLPTTNERVKELFLQKIGTLNCEFSITEEQGETKELRTLLQTLARELDAVLFVQPGTVISKSAGQHFLDKNLDLIIDEQGACAIDHLDVRIESSNFDGSQADASEDQVARKARTEGLLEAWRVKINRHLPYIESEDEVSLRTPREVAQRVSVLATINPVAFGILSPEEAITYLEKYNLWAYTTPMERAFLANPTEERKKTETWKCEGIWTLMWALKKVADLGAPDQLCNLDNIPPQVYPVGPNKDPNEFIDSIEETRTKAEILDAADLYYRLDWASVDARLHKGPIENLHPGVVYERHYALNWLVNYMDEAWDDISCDT